MYTFIRTQPWIHPEDHIHIPTYAHNNLLQIFVWLEVASKCVGRETASFFFFFFY